jgi:hypothetical protein
MSSLSIFPNGTQVRHEARIKNRLINILYGTIQNGSIETDGLGTPMVFRNPMEFIKQHKITKINNKKWQTVNGNPWNIVEYYDCLQNNWIPLKNFNRSPEIPESVSTISDILETEYSLDDDNQSFITCLSEDINDIDEQCQESYQSSIFYEYSYPYMASHQYLGIVSLWQSCIWINKEYIELLQDCQNIEEIEDEMAYELFDKEYPWITRHNLPFEEELWIALQADIPCFGNVWLTQSGDCWEVEMENNTYPRVGNWIGRWSWDKKMMDLGAKEPSNIIDYNEFWDILQDFNESV